MSLTLILITLLLFWLAVALLLWIIKRDLFKKTWRETYIKERVLVIESDDWGPGGDFHAERLEQLSKLLSSFKDSKGRPAVLTADMVLSVPDLKQTMKAPDQQLKRNTLNNDFPIVHLAFINAMEKGVLVPQLHGLEHLHGEGLKRLADKNDPRVEDATQTERWWDWETLDSPLQGHYVDGTSLPTKAHAADIQKAIIDQATQLFEQCFGFSTESTAAPCYLWVDDTEKAWAEKHIQFIQTAGYRCSGRRGDGSYVQDLQETRPGDRNALGQVYLVRNAMYEPVDGRREDDCIRQIEQAYAQASPATISTHRYNDPRTEDEFKMSLRGLQKILQHCTKKYTDLRFASSPELGQWFLDQGNLTNPADKTIWPALPVITGLKKTGPFLNRLWYRHRKIRQIAIVTGLVIPAGLLARVL